MATSDFMGLVDRDLGFHASRVRSNLLPGRRPVPYARKVVDQLAKDHRPSATTVEADDGQRFQLTGIAGWPAQVIILETAKWPDEGLIRAGAALPGFTSAMVGDADDVFWQSEEQVTTYEAFGRGWGHLPTTYDETFECEKIDTSGNAGRRTPAPGMWLWAAATMWFGADAFRIVDRERLMALPVGSLSETDGGLVRVDLFRLSDDINSIREAQREFRAWMRYDELEARSAELAASFNDPQIEIEHGDYPSGGTRRVTHWFSQGVPAAKSVATAKRVVEFGSDGTPLRDEMIEV
ncbi:hypothetical protein ACWZJV_12100 [Nocardioides sp. WG-D5]